MDSNKDEAIRCLQIARQSIASGNKSRALKFIKLAQKLNRTISVSDLLSACESLNDEDPGDPSSSHIDDDEDDDTGRSRVRIEENGERTDKERDCRNYTEENVELVKRIKKEKDYYAILGVERSCSVEEVRKAYRKVSLRVHPDKNKAPGAEEAFKKVSRAFKCLSEGESRREYDQIGIGEEEEEYEFDRQRNNRRRRRRGRDGIYEEEFDPDEIFRAFFGQGGVFGNTHVFRTGGGMGAQQHQRGGGNGGGGGPPGFMVLLQLIPFLLIIMLAYLPFSEPEYSLQKNHTYQLPKVTERYGVEFYVGSEDFDQRYPVGSAARLNLEDNVIHDYRNLLARYCHIELQRRQWSRNMPTPHCDQLQSFGTA